jgi:hypothetical protein
MAYVTSVETQSIQCGEALSPPIAGVELWPSIDPQAIFSAQNWGVSNFVGMHNQVGLYNGLGLQNITGFFNRIGAQTAVGGQEDAQPSVNTSAISMTFNSPSGNLSGGWRYNGSTICAPCPSDQKAKLNVTKLENSLDKVLNLRGVSFNWNPDIVPRKASSQETAVGLIAQEVEQIIPEAIVTETIEDQTLKTVEYGNLVAVLIEAIKEQQGQIDELKETVSKLSTGCTKCSGSCYDG